jgi:uncharacterized protein
MAGLIALLRELHRAHRQVHDLREHLNRLPFQLKAQKAKAAKQEDALRVAQDALKHTKVTIHDKEVSLKSTNQQIEKYERQLNEVTAKKEYDALKTEIARAREQCAKLEDELLTAMTELDERKSALPAVEQAAQNARDALAQFEASAKEKQANLNEELNRARLQLKEIEKGMPEDMKPQYDRIVQAIGADALTTVRNRTCSSCSTEITAQNYNDLLRDRLIICATCDRILYLPE